MPIGRREVRDAFAYQRGRTIRSERGKRESCVAIDIEREKLRCETPGCASGDDGFEAHIKLNEVFDQGEGEMATVSKRSR